MVRRVAYHQFEDVVRRIVALARRRGRVFLSLDGPPGLGPLSHVERAPRLFETLERGPSLVVGEVIRRIGEAPVAARAVDKARKRREPRAGEGPPFRGDQRVDETPLVRLDSL